MQLTSPVFQEGKTIPRQFTADGADQSPPLNWNDPPPGTRSFALICDDPDAPRGTFTHWVLLNVPANSSELKPGVSSASVGGGGAIEGKNDFGKSGYGGPSPPPGKPHRYFFKLYALNGLLELKSGVSKSDVLTAMKGRVLGEAQLMGTYGR